ncbi:MAG: hypothetical protein ACO1OB_28890 [Archangium sp.]
MNSRLNTSILCLVAVAFAGCPQTPSPDPLAPAPTITSFTASAADVTPGSTVTLSWKAENATSVRIDELSLGQVSGVSGNEGTVDVSVNGDSTYVLTVRNDRGAAASAVVAVRTARVARGLVFNALPATIEAGQNTTLAWSAIGTAAVTITANPGGAVDLGGQGVVGSVVVAPAADTTYTLTAGDRTADVAVKVLPAVRSFSGQYTRPDADAGVDAGVVIKLAWETAAANRVQINAIGAGNVVDTTDATRVASGSFDHAITGAVDPAQVFSYELLVTGASGNTSRALVVTVPGSPADTTFTAPALARQSTDGGTITLAWTTSGADSVSISAEGVEFFRAPAGQLATGSVQVPTPNSDTTYELVARATRGGEARKSAAVEVVGVPTITATLTPSTAMAGEMVALAWTGTDVRQVTVRNVTTGVVHTATGMQDTGSIMVSSNESTSYTVEADNSFGDKATAMAALTISNPLTLSVTETGTLRFGQTVSVTASQTGDLVGLPHDIVDVRTGSTGFDDITMTGTSLTMPSNGTAASITTTFRMPFFNRIVGQTLQVSRHGYLGFADISGGNSSTTALPTTNLEDMVVAPLWTSMSTATVRWQEKMTGSVKTLIVQWDTTTISVQAKLYETGQIDFEYKTLSTATARVGVVGALREQTIPVTTTLAVGTGFTFFGPRPQPVSVKAWETGTIIGQLVGVAGPVRGSIKVARPEELAVTELLASSTHGADGQWLELRNSTNNTFELSDWSLSFADGGTLPLSGTLGPRSVAVVGASTDSTVNGGSNVTIAVPGFDLTAQTTVALARGGAAPSVSLTGADAGTAIVNDLGPYTFSTGSPGAQRCTATTSYGSWSQFGTPGTDSNCGFGYELTRIQPGFFDVSSLGAPLASGYLDDTVYTVSLTAAPVQFFGDARTSMTVSTNGFLTFGTATSSTYLASTPATSEPNLVVAVHGGDIGSPAGTIHAVRVGANVDPYAAAPHWVVQWANFDVVFFDDIFFEIYFCESSMNFQVKLFDDGTIESHYGKMLSRNTSRCASGSYGSSWIENAAGTQALTINARTATPGLRSNTAFRYSPR